MNISTMYDINLFSIFTEIISNISFAGKAGT